MRYANLPLISALLLLLLLLQTMNLDGTRTFYTMTGYVVSNTKVQGAWL